MAVAYVNEHNKHDDEDTKPFDLTDAPEEPALKPLPAPDPDRPVYCCARLGLGSWCNLLDKHAGECNGLPPEYGPVEERPALWRSDKGRAP